MEAQGPTETNQSRLASADVRSCLPRRGATSRIRSRLGLRQQGDGDPVSRPLPAIRVLAREMCARRGFDIQSNGSLPSGGTILSVDALNFDRAIVLLSLFNDARVYGDTSLVAPSHCIATLSLRIADIVDSALVESVVRDLVNERTVIMRAEYCQTLTGRRAQSMPMRRARVELHKDGRAQVLIET